MRIVKKAYLKKTSRSYYEDFEDIDEGWGPFVASKASVYKTHLSERHDGYTDDSIDGDFSLETWAEGNGEVYRSSSSIIRFNLVICIKSNSIIDLQIRECIG